jgi:hypothetical protein
MVAVGTDNRWAPGAHSGVREAGEKSGSPVMLPGRGSASITGATGISTPRAAALHPIEIVIQITFSGAVRHAGLPLYRVV